MIRTGDFSGLGQQIYDPTTLVLDASNNLVRAPFAGNQIPIGQIDPVAVKLIDLLPDPLTSDPINNYTFTANSTQRTDQFDVRIDQNIGKSDRVFGKFDYDNTLVQGPGSIPAPSNSSIPLGKYLTGGLNTPQVNWAAVMDFTKVIGTNTVNETRIGAIRWNLRLLPPSLGFNTAEAVGMPGINLSTNSSGIPGFSIAGGFANIGDASTFPETNHTVTWQFENNTNLVRGSHSLTFGARYLRNQLNGYSAFPTRSNWDFNGEFTRQVNTTTTGTALADFALGAPDAVNRGYLFGGGFGERFYGFAAFFEDSWRVSHKLTVNVGLRYEIQSPPYEVHNLWANFNVQSGRLMLAGVNGNSRALRETDLNNFGPRAGIAYSPDDKTTIRAGGGISYTEEFDAGTQLYKNLPFMMAQRITPDQNGAPERYLSQGLPVPVLLNFTDPSINGGSPMAYPMNF